MSTADATVRSARFYTTARRLPWVIGKFADFRIPFGPFNAVQIAVMSVGGLVLVKTASVWWSLTGPAPIVVWIVAIFVCRRHKVAGRTPVGAALGTVARLLQPAGGRTAGRAARDRRHQPLTGTFTLQALPAVHPGPLPESAPAPTPTRPRHAAHRLSRGRSVPAPAASSAAVRRPLSPVQAALLTAKGQN